MPELTSSPCCNKKNHHQRGAAILLAMLVVTLVGTLIAAMQWNQWKLWQQETAIRAKTQANWLLIGALDWARLILREDALSNGGTSKVDHLGEPWALPLKETKLSTFVNTKTLSDFNQNDEVYLTGQMLDAQSKINLTNLIIKNPSEAESARKTYKTLERLYQQLGLSPQELQIWGERWQTLSNKDLRPARLEQLRWLGVPNQSIELLKNHLTILPQRTTINVNTASATVLASTIPSIDLTKAQDLVRARAQSPFQKIADVQALLGSNIMLAEEDFSVSSQFFETYGQLRMGEWVISEHSLVQRNEKNVSTVWRRAH